MLGSRKLSSLSENRPSRKALDAIWDGGFVRRLLETGQWNSAVRAIESTYDPSYDTSDFGGYSRVHTKPSDWVRTVGLSGSENMTPPLMRYEDEADVWVCDLDTIYVRYVSDDDAFGGDVSMWAQSLVNYAECELAYRACRAITGSDSLTEQLRVDSERAKREAKSIDQMNQPSRRPPLSSWVLSRRGSSGRGDIRSTGGLV